MVIYFILLIYVFALSLLLKKTHYSNRTKKFFLFCSFMAITLVIGLRGPAVGEDTKGYFNLFGHAEAVSWSEIFNNLFSRVTYLTYSYGYAEQIEGGYLLLNKVIAFFSDNGQACLFVVAALTCFFTAKCIYENSEDVLLSVIVFLCESMFMNSFNGIRQMLAVSIALQSYSKLKNKKIMSAIFYIFIAGMIHNTAFICLLIIPVMLIKRNRESKNFKYLIMISIALPFMINFFSSVIGKIFPRYINYFTNNYWQNSIGGMALLWLIELAFIIYMYLNKFRNDDSFELSTITLAYLALELMSLKITLFSRLGWYFRMYLILFFPNAIRYFSGKNKLFVKIIVYSLLLLLFVSYVRNPTRTYSFYWE